MTLAARTWHEGSQERYHETLLGSKPRDQLKVVPDSHNGSDAGFSFGRSKEDLWHHGFFGAADWNPRTPERGQRYNVNQVASRSAIPHDSQLFGRATQQVFDTVLCFWCS